MTIVSAGVNFQIKLHLELRGTLRGAAERSLLQFAAAGSEKKIVNGVVDACEDYGVPEDQASIVQIRSRPKLEVGLCRSAPDGNGVQGFYCLSHARPILQGASYYTH